MPTFNTACTACPRLARHLAAVRQDYPDYHAKPVAPFGDPKAKLLIVGLAPGMHGANRTGRPFTGDHAGILLYKTLYRYGFANRADAISVDDGLTLMNCRITNAVKCLPPANKPLPAEVARCNTYLKQELSVLGAGDVILALGRVAHEAVRRALDLRARDYGFGHGRLFLLPVGAQLLNSYHCSRYNTQTGRLTAAMFAAVVRRARDLLNASACGAILKK